MNTLFILNTAPYGDERAYNALRLAHALHKHDPDGAISIFLMADAVTAAKAGQSTPEGYYSMERMLKRVLAAKGRVLLCGACMAARALKESEIIDGAIPSTIDELAKTTLAADKVLVL